MRVGINGESAEVRIVGAVTPVIKGEFTAAGNGNIDYAVITEEIHFALNFVDGDVGVVLHIQIPDAPLFDDDRFHIESVGIVKVH